MATFTPRTIVDPEYQHPYRYELKDINTGETIKTYDIVPTWKDNPSEVFQKGTDIDKAYLQPIEDFLGAISVDLAEIGLSIVNANMSLTAAVFNANANLSATESTLNTKISTTESTLNSKITSTDTALTGRLTTAETSLNSQINAANGRIDTANTTLASKAPLNAPSLINPTANTPAQSDNSTRLTTTAWNKTYLDNLFSAYRG